MGIDLDILMILTLVGMLLAIFSGVHIALALGATAMIGTYFIFEDMYMAASQVGGAAYELIRDHIFMTIPLFVLMGDFLSRSGAAGDLYSLINKGLKNFLSINFSDFPNLKILLKFSIIFSIIFASIKSLS